MQCFLNNQTYTGVDANALLNCKPLVTNISFINGIDDTVFNNKS